MPPYPPRLFGPPLSVSGPPLSKKPGSALAVPSTPKTDSPGRLRIAALEE